SYGDEDQHPPNAVEEPTAIRRDEEEGSARFSKGPVAGSSKS
ncbi:solute carrier family 35 member F1-like, partial [Trifolium medium]|nr:solute carrier family 35 member F1-like [Trifolium medium]